MVGDRARRPAAAGLDAGFDLGHERGAFAAEVERGRYGPGACRGCGYSLAGLGVGGVCRVRARVMPLHGQGIQRMAVGSSVRLRLLLQSARDGCRTSMAADRERWNIRGT